MSDITGSPHWACSEKCKQKKLVTENSVSTVCVCLSHSLFLFLSVYVSFSVCLFVCLSASLSLSVSLSLSLCLCLCLCLCLSFLDCEMRFENEAKIKYLSSLQIVFDAIDSNKDGVISLTEWTYGYLEYLLNSGPDSQMSLWFGPITVNE